MAVLKEQDLLFKGEDSAGNPVLLMPITRIENVEGGIKTINGVEADKNKNVDIDVGVTSVNGQTGAVTYTVPNEFDTKAANPISSTSDDTTTKWASLGGGTYYFSTNVLNNQPQLYGFVINYVCGRDVFQIWKGQARGNMYYRSGNASGWGEEWTFITPTAQVIETWESGSSWYRKWSDGWIEQGGYKSTNTITFNIAFLNTNYYFGLMMYKTGSSNDGWFWYNTKATSSINVVAGDVGFWYACGY